MLDSKSQQSKELFIYSFFAVIIGIIVGVIDAIFGITLLVITDIRDLNPLYFIPFLPLVGLLIIFIYQKIGKNSQKGMGLIFEVGNEEIPKRLIPIVIISTWLTHLFGGSAGREGVAVQLGGTVGYNLGKHLKSDKSRKIMLMTGMAAGFGGLFQTPIAATFFALEVLMAGKIEYTALLPALIGAHVASKTSHLLHLEKFSFVLNSTIEMTPITLFQLLVIGICFGLAGRLFSQLLNATKQKLAKRFKSPFKRIAVIGVLLSIGLLLIHLDRYAGLGTNLINLSFNHGEIHIYDWFFKLVFTILTLAAGFQGGEVTPLFAIGSTLGVTLAHLFGLPVELIAALGYVAVFASATTTYFAPIFIGAEVFGYEAIPYFLPIVTLAYLVNGNHSIYSKQKNIENYINKTI